MHKTAESYLHSVLVTGVIAKGRDSVAVSIRQRLLRRDAPRNDKGGDPMTKGAHNNKEGNAVANGEKPARLWTIEPAQAGNIDFCQRANYNSAKVRRE